MTCQHNESLIDSLIKNLKCRLHRATILRFQPVMSAQLSHCFSVDQCKVTHIDTLSVFNGKVITRKNDCPEIFIIGEEGNYLNTIMTDFKDETIDAIWTPRGNIAYTTFRSKRVVVITETGIAITQYQMTQPIRLSVSYDDIIYLADFLTGVYQSTDDGVSWSLVFNLTDDAYLLRAVKAETALCYDFWTIVWYKGFCYLRVYCKQKGAINANITWKNIQIPLIDGKTIDLTNGSLLFDGNSNIFLSDRCNKIVHLYSLNGQYSHQLLSAEHMQSAPTTLAVDRAGRLYIGQERNSICVFNLLFHNETNYL